MRIAFLTASLRQGGAERVISSLSNELAGREHEIIIYTLSADESFYTLNGKVRQTHIRANGKGIIKNATIITSLKRQLKVDRPNILVSFDSRTLVYSVLARINKLALVYSERSNPLVYPIKPVWRRLRDMAMNNADLCIFQTQSVASLYPKLAEKSVVIPNAIFNPKLNKVCLPEKRENCISAMGRLDCSIKGFDKIICAFALMEKEFPEIGLKIYGVGKDRDLLKNLANRKGVGDRVEIIEGNENAIFEVAKSRLFILFSYFEGFPNALIEAMACGVPCISSDCDFGPRDIISHGSNGCLVRVGDVEGLEREMRAILNNQLYADEIGSNGKITSENYALPNIVEKWENCLRSVIEQRNK